MEPANEMEQEAALSCQSSELNLMIELIGDLYENGRNVLLSPYSVVSALAMLVMGTNGNTRDQLANVLLGQSGSQLECLVDKLCHEYVQLANRHKNVLQQANLIVAQNWLTFNTKFSDRLAKCLMGETKRIDLENSAQQAADAINKHVSKVTNGLINGLIERLDKTVAILLINVIHFKDQWKHQFIESKTIKCPFRLSNGTTIIVDMMHQTALFGYGLYQPLDLNVIQLHYGSNTETSMIILLPEETTKTNNIGQLLEKLTTHHLKAILANIQPNQRIQLAMPRFRMSSTHQLTGQLRKMGIDLVFDADHADLSTMVDKSAHGEQEKLFVSQVIHKAVIEVNEYGTEAAAVSKATVRNKRSCQFIQEITCDRPFIYLVINQANRGQLIVLFGGILENPLE